MLSKTQPIVIEKELYFSNENASQREFILLNEVLLNIDVQREEELKKTNLAISL